MLRSCTSTNIRLESTAPLPSASWLPHHCRRYGRRHRRDLPSLPRYYLHDFSKCRTEFCEASQLQIKRNGYCVECSFQRRRAGLPVDFPDAEGLSDAGSTDSDDARQGLRKSVQPAARHQTTRINKAMLTTTSFREYMSDFRFQILNFAHSLDAVRVCA